MPNVYQVLRRRQHLTQTQSFGMVIKYFINSASLTRDYVKSSWEVIRCRQHLYCNVTQRLRGNGKTFIGHVIVHSIRTDANIQNIYQVLHLHMRSCKMFPVQTCQCSRLSREAHGIGPNLQVSRLPSKISRFSSDSANHKLAILSLPFWIRKTCFYLHGLSI